MSQNKPDDETSDSSGGNDTHGNNRREGQAKSRRGGLHSTPVIEGLSRKRQKQSLHQLNQDMFNTIAPYIYKGTGCVPRDIVQFQIDACVTTIRSYAFQFCTRITELSIPSSVTTIGQGAFQGCTGISELSIPSSVTTIGQIAFQGCTGITELSISSSVIMIEGRAFADCTGITELSIPSSVTTIGWGAFEGCTGITELSIPSSVTTIKGWAFGGCTRIVAICLPENLTAISSSTFRDCYKLATVNEQHGNSPGVFATFLHQAGFSPIEQKIILFGLPIYRSEHDLVYYNVEKLARTRNVDGRLPLFTAAANSLVWAEMKRFLAANMIVLHEVDSLTGLPLFMLAAIDESSDLESVYKLLVEYPPAILMQVN